MGGGWNSCCNSDTKWYHPRSPFFANCAKIKAETQKAIGGSAGKVRRKHLDSPGFVVFHV